MSSYDDAYVKDIEKQNEQLRDQNYNLQACYDLLEKFFILSHMKTTKGEDVYRINVKAVNHTEIEERTYHILVRLGLECEPEVDMNRRFDNDGRSIAELNAIIEEGRKELAKYAGP